VASSRHKHVLRAAASRPRRLLKIGVPTLATLAIAGSAVAATVPANDEPVQAIEVAHTEPQVRSTPVPMRVESISRSEGRVRLKEKPPEVNGRMFAVDAVNIRVEPRADARRAGSLEWAEKIAISGENRGPWVEVVVDKKSRWVHGDFLAEKKPKPEPEPKPEPAPEPEPAEEETSAPPAETGLSSSPCSYGSSVESGLVSNAVSVYRSVCASFPSVSSYGGVRPGDSGEHGTGQALDIMISGDPGWEVAEYVRANAGQLGVSYVIYAQKIWSADRAGEGWRYMEDRGSTTANHYDHVHVSVH
jgi:hypothetical protein